MRLGARETMARPLEFEYVIEAKDAKKEYERLLSKRPNDAARRTMREAERLDMSRLHEKGQEKHSGYR